MRKVIFLVVVAGLAGWGFFQKFRLDGLDKIGVKPRGAVATSADAPAVPLTATIRIASFDLDGFGPAKLARPEIVRELADVLRWFDLTAVQEIRSPRDDTLMRLLDQVNATGRHYDYLIGPRRGNGAATEQFAYIFDTATIETDRTTVYTVDDPGRRLAHEPLVAAFRVRGPAPSDAFTFTLINAHVEHTNSAAELDALADAYRAVRSDGRGEDDVLIVGNLNADDRHLGALGSLPSIATVLSATPTTARGTKMCDNMLYNRQATIEYTGRAGVLDVASELNLPMTQVLELSDHLPVWAEFSVYEGGQPGHFAERTDPGQRFWRR